MKFRDPRSAIRAICVFVALSLAAACGKKGPPLAPLIPVPAAVELIDARRVGNDVYVSVTIPAANIDQHTPADIERVEVYAYTGRAQPPRARWVEFATLVATVPVAPPPLEPGEKPDRAGASPIPADAPLQGTKITVRDRLTPEELVQGREPPAIPDSKRRAPSASTVADAKERIADRESRIADRGSRIAELKRFYIGVPFSKRGRNGPLGAVAELPLSAIPDAPPSAEATYTDRSIAVSWEPSGGLLGFLFERTLPDDVPPVLEDEPAEGASAEPLGPLGYLVYREMPPDALSPPPPVAGASWHEEAPSPVTAIPLAVLAFTDSVEFGRRRCYTVRAVRGAGPEARVGDSSPAVCVTPIDTFPPAPPRALAAVASEGAINLIWEPNGELDLGGYVVLRGEAPGETLQPLTTAPIPNVGYRDDTVKPGVRYVYAVVAVDNRFPVPNMSVESARAEETAR